ncbi:MAG: TolC family protein [Sediminibacterium sp.]|nr:TolC family protein [Sediminibacterium sp.]
MNRIFIIGIGCFLFFSQLNAQGNANKWNLQRCVDYAAKNNISVKQADVQARLAALDIERSKLIQYPSVSFGTNLGTQFGRSIDPTTNQFTTTQLLFQGANLNVNVPVYNWGALNIDRKIASFNAQAAVTEMERIINDVSLTIATFFLQVVAAQKQIEIAEVQIAQSNAQFGFTKKRVEAGVLPELSAAEIEAQLARDTTTLVNAQASYSQAVIQLKAAINLDMAAPFEVEIPAVDQIPLEPLSELEPAILYQLALNNQPAQKVNALRLKSAEESVKRAKTAFYPSLTAFGTLGTNFANTANMITGANVLGTRPTSNFVTVASQNYLVYQPDVQLTTSKRSFGQFWNGWGTQLDQNFRQSFGINLSVPIFSNGSARLGYERAKLNKRSSEVTKLQTDLTLQQNIYQSHANALAAMLRYNASKKSVEATQKAFDFATKRYEAGLSNTLDLITNQNNLLRTKLDQLNSQFDYIFRIKLLEFYKGQGIKL